MHRHPTAAALLLALAACDAGPTAPRGPATDVAGLGVGEALTVAGERAGGLSVAGGAEGAEFVLVAWLGSEAAGARLPLRVTATGVGPTAEQPPAAAAPVPSGQRSARGGAAWADHAATPLHRALRASEHDLAARIAAEQRPSAARAGRSPSAPPPAVGALVSINAQAAGPPKSCTVPDPRTGRVMAVGERAVVVADTANPAGGFTAADYRGFALALDTLVYPVAARNFGEPADIDGNGRIVLFFTRAVNEVAAGGRVLGFFYGRDLLPRSSCPHGNAGEYIFMAVPDPAGAAGGQPFPREAAMEGVEPVLVHELQHLISGSRRLYVHGVRDPWEETWLNEGLSHVAEELLFYHASGLAPGRNLGAAELASSPAARRAFERFQAANLRRYSIYLETTEEASPYLETDDSGVRGAAWAFLRYAADRGDGGAAPWHRLVNSRSKGIANLEEVLGAGRTLALLRDWTVAVYADDALPRPGAAHSQPSWDFRSLLAVSPGRGEAPRFPLATRSLAEGAHQAVRLGGRGTASFLRFGVAPSGRAEIRLDPDGGARLPAGLTVTVLRTR